MPVRNKGINRDIWRWYTSFKWWKMWEKKSGQEFDNKKLSNSSTKCLYCTQVKSTILGSISKSIFYHRLQCLENDGNNDGYGWK